MEEEKRTYQIDTEVAPELRLRFHQQEEQKPENQVGSSQLRDRKFLSEELIVGLIQKIKAL